MKAHVDDELVVRSPHVDEHVRFGRIVEVRGEDGEPPYLVHWDDTDHTVLVYPGPDAQVQPAHPGTDATG